MPIKQEAQTPGTSSSSPLESRAWRIGYTKQAQTILVVDDEPLVRIFVARALKAAGYRLIEAGSAERAMEVLKLKGSSVALLLSDVGLPGASGPELLGRARLLRPDLPALLMSAWSKASVLERHSVASGIEVLQKPFAVEDLLGRIEALLTPCVAPPALR